MSSEAPPIEFPPLTALEPRGPPSGVFHCAGGAIPPRAFAARVQVTGDGRHIDPELPLYAFALQVEVLDAAPRANETTLEAIASGRAWDFSEVDYEESQRPRVNAYWAPCEVVIRAVLPDGASASVHAQGYKPYAYVQVQRSERDRADTSAFVRAMDEIAREMSAPRGAISYNFVQRRKAFGYVPDPKRPGTRASFVWAVVRCPNPRTLSRVCAALADARGFPVEEGDRRIKPSFKFCSEHSLQPCSWFVISRGFELVRASGGAPRKSLRSVMVVCEARRVRGLEFAREKWPDKFEHAWPVGPRKIDLPPPCLFVYADIEARSHDPNEFPDPTKPNAPCYIIGVSFAWAFDLPPALLRPSAADSEEDARIARANVEAETRRRVAEAARAREERLRARAERLRRWGGDPEVLRALGGAPEALNSDDESEGPDAEVAKLEHDARGTLKKRLALLDAQGKAKAWPSGVEIDADRWLEVPPWGDAAFGSGPGAVVGHPFLRVLLVLGRCAHVPGAVVLTFDTEAELLMAYRAVTCGLMDADGTRGYNWFGFDAMYLMERSKVLGISESFMRLGHMPDVRTQADEKPYEFRIAAGTFKLTRTPGTNTVDLYLFMRRNMKLSSYKLDAVAKIYGFEGKHPVTHKHIYRAFRGTAEQRAVVAAYCAQDCDLLAHVARESLFETTAVQFAAVQRTDPEAMWTTGQQLPITHCMLWLAHREGFVINHMFKHFKDPRLSGKFEGGFVMEPTRGQHDTVFTLDFASLYPSIMRAHRLCFSSALLEGFDDDETIERIRADGVEVDVDSYKNGTFAWVQTDDNLVPRLEEQLAAERKVAKRMMANSVSPTEMQTYNQKQLAIKVVMNAIYGTLGAAFGHISMSRIAYTITWRGRRYIKAARDFANSLRSVSAELPGVGEVLLVGDASPETVYGDTDSIMVRMPEPTVDFIARVRAARLLGDATPPDGALPTRQERLISAALLGMHIANAMNATYRRPMELEPEEIALTAIFVNPKCYAKYTVPIPDVCGAIDELGRAAGSPAPSNLLVRFARGEVIGKLKASGLAAVRRDRCALARNLQSKVMRAVAVEDDKEKAIRLIRRYLVRLATGLVSWEDLTVTTGLSSDKPSKVGNVAPPHLAVTWALEKKAPGTQPAVGERVPWVIVREKDETRIEPPARVARSNAGEAGTTPLPPPQKSPPLSMFARHPSELADRIPRTHADLKYYMDHQLEHPFRILFDNIRPDLMEAVCWTRETVLPLMQGAMTGKRQTRLAFFGRVVTPRNEEAKKPTKRKRPELKTKKFAFAT